MSKTRVGNTSPEGPQGRSASSATTSDAMANSGNAAFTASPASTPGLTVASIASSVTPASPAQHTNTNNTDNNSRSEQTPWALGSTVGAGLGRSTATGLSMGSRSSQSQSGNGVRVGMHVRESPSPGPPSLGSNTSLAGVGAGGVGNLDNAGQSHPFASSDYQSRLLNQKSSEAVEAVLAASCAAMGFDIAEMWLRTGPKTHQLINSHLRHTALDETMRDQLVEVYYGDSASDRTHRLSPALCKKAKQDNDVVWVTAQTESGARALKCSLNGVLTAVAVPVCHEPSNTNITVIYFSVRRATMRPEAIEFLIHMSIATAVAGVNTFNEDDGNKSMGVSVGPSTPNMNTPFHYGTTGIASNRQISESHAHASSSISYGIGRPMSAGLPYSQHPTTTTRLTTPDHKHKVMDTSRGIRPVPSDDRSVLATSTVTGASLNLTWTDLRNIEYLTDGGNNWIHTAVMNKTPIVIKQLKPEVQDVAVAMNEIEGELAVHRLLNHKNIVSLYGAGFTSSKSRFIVMERLDGGTLTQVLGYDTRIRDRRRRFWKKNKLVYIKVLECAKQIAEAMDYCHRSAVDGSMVLHRDLKPDNIGLTLGGDVKIIDFGLARVVENSSANSDDTYQMSGETGSLRYMAPEVASGKPYNHKVDVYSFGMILWELVAYEKPFDGMNREQFYDRVVHGGYRPDITKKFPNDLADLIRKCWSYEATDRPNFDKVIEDLDVIISKEKDGKSEKKNHRFFGSLQRMGSHKKEPKEPNKRKLVDRHSTWF